MIVGKFYLISDLLAGQLLRGRIEWYDFSFLLLSGRPNGVTNLITTTTQLCINFFILSCQFCFSLDTSDKITRINFERLCIRNSNYIEDRVEGNRFHELNSSKSSTWHFLLFMEKTCLGEMRLISIVEY